jgi:hypothetical protein
MPLASALVRLLACLKPPPSLVALIALAKWARLGFREGSARCREFDGLPFVSAFGDDP